MTHPVPTIRLLLLAVLLAAVNAAATFRPDWIPGDILPLVNLVLGMFLALETLWLARAPKSAGTPAADKPAPATAATRDERAKHELARFLGLFQEKGRLVDFLMEDVRDQPDARVGQVARVVHQGCRKVLDEHFTLDPVRAEPEGEALSLGDSMDPETLRLVGSVPDEGDLRGTLLHKGWKTTSVTLPQLNRDVPENAPFYVVAPAEVEVHS